MVSECIASLIPETVQLCQQIFDLVVNPLVEGRDIQSLRMESARRAKDLSLLQLVAPIDSDLASTVDVASVGSLDEHSAPSEAASIEVEAQVLVELARSGSADDTAAPFVGTQTKEPEDEHDVDTLE